MHADFGIVVALPIEREAVLKQLRSYSRVTYAQSDNRTYYRSVFETKAHNRYDIVTTLLPRMGNIDAALATNDMIWLWKPRYVLVIGIAGGVDNTRQRFGDVVVSESILYYEQQKLRKGNPEVRPRTLNADPLLYDRAFNLRSVEWYSQVPIELRSSENIYTKPNVHFGPIASGEKVIAEAEVIKTLLKLQPKLEAVETESAGAASAALSSVQKTGFLAIRGISDFADEAKDDNYHEWAANTAAAWAFDFIASEPISVQTTTAPKPELEPTPQSINRVQLFHAIQKRVNNDGFKTLCFLLGVDVDNIPGETKAGKVRELILYFERRNMLEKLQQIWTRYIEDEV